MTANEVKYLRSRFNLSQTDFAHMLGVSLPSVARWETNRTTPTGTAEAILLALQEKLQKDPDTAPQVIKFVRNAGSISLSYLILKLLDQKFP